MEKNINNLRKDIFSVPEGYFDGVEDRILDRLSKSGGKIVPLNSNEETASKTTRLRKWVVIVGLAAASFAGLIMFNMPKTQTDIVDFSGITNDEIATYLKDNVNDIDLDMIVSSNADLINSDSYPAGMTQEEYNVLIDEISIDDITD